MVSHLADRKGWSNKDDDTKKPAAGSRGNGNGVYTGPTKKATGKATMYSGVQSADNPFQSATSYYEGKGVPARKSLAFESQKKSSQYNYKETPGQMSMSNSMGNNQNNDIYNSHVQNR